MSDTLSPLFTWRSAIMETTLKPGAKYMALALSLHMNERGQSCFPTLETLCEEMTRGKEAVLQGIKELEDAGWLIVHRPKVQGRGHRNHYEASLPEGFSPGPFLSKRVLSAPVKGSVTVPKDVKEDVKGLSLNGDYSCSKCDGLKFAGPRGLANHLKNVHDEVPA